MDSVPVFHELAFRVGFTGHSGHLRVEPLPFVHRSDTLQSLPDLVLPPAYPPETEESVKKYLEDRYLQPELDTEEFSPEKSGRLWEFDWFDKAKVPLHPSAPRVVVVPSWELPFRRKVSNKDAHWVPDSVQIDLLELIDGAQDFGGLPRMPGPAKDFVRGNIKNQPFRPGGLDVIQESDRNIPEGASSGDWVRELIEGGPAQTVPPSFKRGLELGSIKEYPSQSRFCCEVDGDVPIKKQENQNLDKYMVQFDDLFKKAWEDDVVEQALNAYAVKESEILEEPTTDGLRVSEAGDVEFIPESEASLDILLSTEIEVKRELFGVSGSGNMRQDREGGALIGGAEDIVTNFYDLVPQLAIDFPFELDKFQKEAIYYMEKGDSVFVAAHTSAGKTVVAEYAFALATNHCTRAVYTAPIKTISNQKYRDFCSKFDVGLLTGDVSIRPEATCLIMTTEILRSMLYRGADIIRDIEWVIFDEVHYVNDAERGVVWEEVIIMLPKHINIILLSATVPNTIEFADWIGRTKQKKIRVTSTTKRPVPLEHCLFYSGEMYTICENDIFVPEGYKMAKAIYKKKQTSMTGVKLGPKVEATGSHNATQGRHIDQFNKKKGQKSGKHQPSNFGTLGEQQDRGGPRRSEFSFWSSLVNKLLKKNLLPVVVFCFSKVHCDRLADRMASSDLTTHSEKSEIRLFCDKAFSRLKGSDRKLPQVVRLESLLRRGIGAHHAGLLPIVKEVVEMLFCRGVIKVLFSTETFAMGVNAPARTVVFDALKKFDGKDHRTLLPGEYIQMAGRAGRRGLDKIGTVIVACQDEIPEESDVKNLIVGKPTRLESRFRLTYTMILHLLRAEELKVEDMLKRSFAEFHAQKNLPEKEKLLLQKLCQPLKPIECIKGEPSIEEYFDTIMEAEAFRESVVEAVLQKPAGRLFLSPGRVIIVKSQSVGDHLLGVVLKSPSVTYSQYIVLLLLGDSASVPNPALYSSTQQDDKFEQGYFIKPKGKRGMDDEYYSSVSSRKGSGAVNIKLPYHGNAAGWSYEVVALDAKEFISLCNCKIEIDQIRLLEEASNTAYSKTVQKLLEQKPGGNKFPPPLDPITDLKLKDMHLVEQYRAYNKLIQKNSENKCHGCIKLKEHLSLMKEQKKHKDEVNILKFQMSDDALQQMPEFQGRIDVLKEINCIDSDLVVQLKGRVACEMNSGEELICTEWLFENQLDDLEPEEAVAIMSALVFQQRNTSEPSLTPKLAQAKQRLYDIAIRLGMLQSSLNVPVDPEEYAKDNLKFGLVQVVYEWAKGTPFANICELTDVSEGMIVRTIVRLDETCREFRNAASIMGNSALHKKMETASNAIKRDIVFAASLYVTGV